MEMITSKDLLAAGMRQGPWFRKALEVAHAALAAGVPRDIALGQAMALNPEPFLSLQTAPVIHVNLEAVGASEEANRDAVLQSMDILMRTPVVRAGAVMPDACPSGPPGTIPVGGVVASEAIHPGMHSADICCSMAMTVFDDVAPATLLDAVHAVTHFGPGGRPRGAQWHPPDEVMAGFAGNALLRGLSSLAIEHFGTQGDGNHFAYVGTLESTGQTALVTHHGSRGPGAKLYRKGMDLAEKWRLMLSPQTLPANAWIPADSEDGKLYWSALQTIRLWTRENHMAIHDTAATRAGATIQRRFWNEHNFVFLRNGLFYHAKGATPAFDGWAVDATDLTLIPLNMREPILIARGRNAAHGLGFAPHGAGRNVTRTAHKRAMGGRGEDEIFREETKGIDARFFSGKIDISELPSAYKNAAHVRDQISRLGLADIVDTVQPFGCIMAGDWERDAPWRRRREQKVAAGQMLAKDRSG